MCLIVSDMGVIYRTLCDPVSPLKAVLPLKKIR